MPLFEIRNYHFNPAKFDEYKIWAEASAVPYLKRTLDVVGFWVRNEMTPEYKGSLPIDEGVQPANITWIIRWEDQAHKDRGDEEWGSAPEWKAIFGRVPGGRASYLRTEVKFATEL